MNFCRRKLETKSRKFACNGFVYFKFNKENCREPTKQQQNWKTKGDVKPKLYSISELYLCLSMFWINGNFFKIMDRLSILKSLENVSGSLLTHATAQTTVVNLRDTGTPKLLNEVPKIANWYLSRSSIIGGRIRPRVCPSSTLATWQVRQMGVLFYFLGRFLCGERMYVSTLKMDGKTCMLQLQLRQARMQIVLV